MIAHVLRIPFNLDPLIAEAKRRCRRRRLLIVTLLAAAVAGAATASVLVTRSGSPAGTSGSDRVGLRFCGSIPFGIGWRVKVDASLSCSSGMKVMQAYTDALRQGVAYPGTSWLGYRCGPASPVSYRCMRGASNVVAIANH